MPPPPDHGLHRRPGERLGLRPARPGDAEAIGTYHHRCWVLGYVGLVPADVLAGLDVADRVERWRRLLAGDPGRTVVVTGQDDVPLGHVRVEADEITNVYVDPDHWGRGIGRRLLGVGEGLLVAAGHEQGVLWTIVGNRRAVALYRSAGWALDGTRATHPSSAGVDVDEQRMVKRLRRPS